MIIQVDLVDRLTNPIVKIVKKCAGKSESNKNKR